jgi:thioredoxin reductase
VYDVIVIGGGTAGLSAALVLGRQRRQVLLIDAGQPRNARSDGMHMYLSRDGAPPTDFLAAGRAELTAYPGITTHSGTVASITGTTDDFTIEFPDRTHERARRLILATGQVDEPYDIPGVPERFGHSIFHCPFCHGWEARDKTLAVLGRDPAQVMLAAYLADRYSGDVTVLTHGPHQLPDKVLTVLASRGVPIRTEPVTGVTGERDRLEVHLANGEMLARQAIFHRAPTRQSNAFAEKLGATILEDGCVQVNEFQATSVPGLYAAGDMARLPALPDALTLVSQAAADGVRAAVWLEQDLFRSGLPSQMS